MTPDISCRRLESAHYVDNWLYTDYCGMGPLSWGSSREQLDICHAVITHVEPCGGSRSLHHTALVVISGKTQSSDFSS